MQARAYGAVVWTILAGAGAAQGSCPLPDHAWSTHPLFAAPIAGPVTQKFGPRHHPILNLVKMHTGIDYSGAVGAALKVAADGAVIEADRSGQYGNLIVIDHGNGIATAYAHLANMKVGEGDCVHTGETIAGRGNTGLSSEPHLHFEVRRDGTAVDPEPLLRSAMP